MSQPRVALVHDILTQYGGAERVLEAFTELYPEAPIFTLVVDWPGLHGHFAKADIRPSFINSFPRVGRAGYKWYLPLLPRAIESFRLDDYDLVISDASAFAKGVKLRDQTKHVCYLHTPTRYLWTEPDSYLADSPVPRALQPVVRQELGRLRRWDYQAARKVGWLIANSEATAQRSRIYYDREPDLVLLPPVNTADFTAVSDVGDYWLMVGRQETYKRTDLAIAAANELKVPLVVVGGGQAMERWRALAGPTVRLTGFVSDKELARLYAQAKALIFPQEEDAGIVPLEAMASGRPVLAYGAGGALETVLPGQTGAFFTEQTVPALVAAMQQFRPEAYDPVAIVRHAKQYDTRQFQKKFNDFLRLHNLGQS